MSTLKLWFFSDALKNQVVQNQQKKLQQNHLLPASHSGSEIATLTHEQQA